MFLGFLVFGFFGFCCLDFWVFWVFWFFAKTDLDINLSRKKTEDKPEVRH